VTSIVLYPLMTLLFASLIGTSTVLIWKGVYALTTRTPLILSSKGPTPFAVKPAVGCIIYGIFFATPGAAGLIIMISKYGFAALLRGPAAP
jgi:hypothetical protein